MSNKQVVGRRRNSPQGKNPKAANPVLLLGKTRPMSCLRCRSAMAPWTTTKDRSARTHLDSLYNREPAGTVRWESQCWICNQFVRRVDNPHDHLGKPPAIVRFISEPVSTQYPDMIYG